MTGRFAGRVVVITGASRGIGAPTALALAKLGADLALVARTVDAREDIGGSLAETAAAVREHGVRCLAVGADLGDPADRAAVVPTVIAEYGRIDVLINNAAAAIYGSPVTYSDKRRRLTMEVNFFAPFELTQAMIPPMVERGEGWVVNLTSGAATHKTGPPFDNPIETGVYGASKAALDRMTNAMGVALYGTGVRVNSVRPRAAVLSEGANILVGGVLRPDQIEPMDTMVAAIRALCDCPADRTAGSYISGDLLAEITAAEIAAAAPNAPGSEG